MLRSPEDKAITVKEPWNKSIRYMICVTLFCTLCKSENTWTCKNRTRNTLTSENHTLNSCYSRTACQCVFWLTQLAKTCDKIWSLRPLPSAYRKTGSSQCQNITYLHLPPQFCSSKYCPYPTMDSMPHGGITANIFPRNCIPHGPIAANIIPLDYVPVIDGK